MCSSDLKYRCIHGSFVKSLIGSMEAFLYRSLKTYRLIDTAVCPSRFLKEKMDTCPGLRGKTVVMHNFVETEKGGGAEKSKEPFVLYFGRYSREKGIDTLLKVCEKLPNIPFVFAGAGELEDQVNRMKNIVNKGFLRGRELADLIGSASFSVFPSECNENCPFAVMESLLYGTPVIGADIGGVSELIEDGRTGLLFESGDEEQLRSRIRLLWNDREKLNLLQKECGETEFDSVESYCEKLMKYYV